MRTSGTVKWWDSQKGYGFITPTDGGKDVFVHFTGIRGEKGRRDLETGQSVEYEVEQGKKGPQATDVARSAA